MWNFEMPKSERQQQYGPDDSNTYDPLGAPFRERAKVIIKECFKCDKKIKKYLSLNEIMWYPHLLTLFLTPKKIMIDEKSEKKKMKKLTSLRKHIENLLKKADYVENIGILRYHKLCFDRYERPTDKNSFTLQTRRQWNRTIGRLVQVTCYAFPERRVVGTMMGSFCIRELMIEIPPLKNPILSPPPPEDDYIGKWGYGPGGGRIIRIPLEFIKIVHLLE
eukprot:GHVL01021300.1.p1 GENE.GHVL01021300.1~~GHVL01021300.1.p1  ORF type:complete len:220 (+),score=39.87 GHVL01021300.1:717-1376(+)